MELAWDASLGPLEGQGHRGSCSEGSAQDLLRQSKDRTVRHPECGRLLGSSRPGAAPASATYPVCDLEP